MKGVIADNLIIAGRVPPTKAEMESTAILRVRVERGSAKVRLFAREGRRGDDLYVLRFSFSAFVLWE